MIAKAAAAAADLETESDPSAESQVETVHPREVGAPMTAVIAAAAVVLATGSRRFVASGAMVRDRIARSDRIARGVIAQPVMTSVVVIETGHEEIGPVVFEAATIAAVLALETGSRRFVVSGAMVRDQIARSDRIALGVIGRPAMSSEAMTEADQERNDPSGSLVTSPKAPAAG